MTNNILKNRFKDTDEACRLSPPAKSICCAVVIVLLALSFSLAGERGLWSSLETQSAQIARELIESKNWIVPHLNGAEDNEKPALYFWLISLFSLISGKVTGLTARLPSLLSAVFIIFLFFLLAEGREKKSLPFIASVVFLANPKIFWMSQVARIDMTFSLLCFASVVFFVLHLRDERPGPKNLLLYAFFLFSGLAVLCKGPVGAYITFFPVIIFLVLHKKTGAIKISAMLKGFLLFTAVAVPWYMLVIWKTDGRFFEKFIMADNLGRFLGPSLFSYSKEFSKSQPFWFYVPQFLAGFFPWSILSIAFIWNFFRTRKSYTAEDSFFLIYFFVIFLFFSAAGIKRSDYIMPLYPAVSWLIAAYVLRALPFPGMKIFFIFSSVIIIAILLAFSVFPPYASELLSRGDSFLLRFFPPEDIEKGMDVIQYARTIYLSGFLVLGAVTLLFLYGFFMKKTASMFVVLAAVYAVVFAYAGIKMLPFVDSRRNILPFCETISPIVARGELWFYDMWNDEFVFYLGRSIRPSIPGGAMGRDEFLVILGQKERTVFFLIRKKDYTSLINEGVVIPYACKENAPALYPVYLISNNVPEKAPHEKK
jgi:4-amino-4-deoxy-L-arabinose transferase-like glycosyltransferase